MSERTDLQSLAALDALGLLDETERLDLERTLASSPELREELQDLYEVAAALPRVLPLETPSLSPIRIRVGAVIAASSAIS